MTDLALLSIGLLVLGAAVIIVIVNIVLDAFGDGF